ncbi:hypothetical protein MLD38_008451 [Melastoma candidum]|uniref:Uncharacterized protein n=1 Tax=Melastoma candidum TaxID=119954 RepID=A0ACB9RUC5_9MYRT|nr:hypothetical protein MLD38_008451 [Melastoma candidum]
MTTFNRLSLQAAVLFLVIVHPVPSAAHNKTKNSTESHPIPPPTVKTQGGCDYAKAFRMVFAFGDSDTDPGNALLTGSLTIKINPRVHKSENPFSDGKLLIDYVCETLGIPPVPAYQNSSADFSHGANFALAGTSCLTNIQRMHSRIHALLGKVIPGAINLQLSWFKKYLQVMAASSGNQAQGGGSLGGSGSGNAHGTMGLDVADGDGGGIGEISGNSGVASSSGTWGNGGHRGSGSSSSFSSDSQSGGVSGGGSISGSGSSTSRTGGSAVSKALKDVLFWVGPIGGNDYARLYSSENPSVSSQWISQQTINQVTKLVTTLLETGAKYIVVQGLPPVGCLPATLSSTPSSDRDEHGCSTSANAAVSSHNEEIQQFLALLQKTFVDCTIVFADFYKAYMTVIKSPELYHIIDAFSTCCGLKGGAVNFNPEHPCGAATTTACQKAAGHVIWDGIHLTAQMNKYVAEMFLNQTGYTQPCLMDVARKKLSS